MPFQNSALGRLSQALDMGAAHIQQQQQNEFAKGRDRTRNKLSVLSSLRNTPGITEDSSSEISKAMIDTINGSEHDIGEITPRPERFEIPDDMETSWPGLRGMLGPNPKKADILPAIVALERKAQSTSMNDYRNRSAENDSARLAETTRHNKATEAATSENRVSDDERNMRLRYQEIQDEIRTLTPKNSEYIYKEGKDGPESEERQYESPNPTRLRLLRKESARLAKLIDGGTAGMASGQTNLPPSVLGRLKQAAGDPNNYNQQNADEILNGGLADVGVDPRWQTAAELLETEGIETRGKEGEKNIQVFLKNNKDFK